MAIRIMATLERFVSEDAGGGTAADKAKRAVTKLTENFQQVIDGDSGAETRQQTVDDSVAGLKSEAEVGQLTDRAASYGGRPSAAPAALTTAEDTERTISLADFGFSDAEADEEFGAITFTGLDLLGGRLVFTAAVGFRYGTQDVGAGDQVTAVAGQRIHIAWVGPGGFTFLTNGETGTARRR